MLEQVRKTISRYSMLGSGSCTGDTTRIAVAVSGGPDSVALVHVLAQLASQLGASLSVAHFNHKLRGADSDADEAFVADLAARLNLPFHTEKAAALDIAAGHKENLEQWARNSRLAFFQKLREDGQADLIATGHTRDDQAETVLFRLLRGSGLTGLAGILPVSKRGIIRPLIEVSRDSVREYLRMNELPWREDATNLETKFARNRIRHVLMPELEQEWNPRIPEALAHLADLAQEEERWWNAVIARRAAALFVPWNGGVDMEVASLTGLPRALTRRLIRHAIDKVKGNLRRIEYSHVEAVLELVGQASGEGRLSLPGVDVMRSFGWIRLASDVAPAASGSIPLTVPGVYPLVGDEVQLMLEVLQKNARNPCATLKAAELSWELGWNNLPSPLELRGWKPGDCYRPVGQNRVRNVAELFESARVPSWRRLFWPMVTVGDRILWAKQFGVASEYAANSESRTVLRVSEVRTRNS